MPKPHEDWDTGVNRFLEGAVTVLKKSRRPLSVREIVSKMVEQQLVEPSGRTPQNSMQNTIRRANERRKAQGQPPLFIRKQEAPNRVVYSLKE
jgi:hypothetical protein